MDLVAAEYGWSDEQILGLTLARLRQVVAAIQRRQWLTDLNHRRIETAKLRALCTYVAATMQIAEGESNPMLDAAVELHLGTGTEHPDSQAAGTPDEPEQRPSPARGAGRGAGGGAGGGAGMPHARIPTGNLADAPVAVRPGQPTPPGPTGSGGQALRPIPYERLGEFLGGGR